MTVIQAVIDAFQTQGLGDIPIAGIKRHAAGVGYAFAGIAAAEIEGDGCGGRTGKRHVKAGIGTDFVAD